MKLGEAGTFTCLECKSIIRKEDFLTKIKVKTPKRGEKERKKLKKEKREDGKLIKKKRNMKRRKKKKKIE